MRLKRGRTPTIHDVAEALGLHTSTVSLALSGKGNVSAATRARVATTARKLGYVPNPLAQQLARGTRDDMVCLFSGVLDVGLATAKILAVQQALSARALDVPIYVDSDPPDSHRSTQVQQVRQLRRQRPRAIVCFSQRVDTSALRELAVYQKEGGIVVSFDAPVPLKCDQVIFDREDNAYRAARHLLERGHRRLGLGITIVPGSLDGPEGVPVRARLQGFHRALAEFDLPMREDWLFQNPTYERGGAEMARRFLALQDRPTGVCIVNDYVALAFMVEVLRAGVRIPEDLSIVSHDNQFIANYCPVPLTSMTHPAQKIVDTVVAMLLERIQGRMPARSAPRRITIVSELVERASVGPPRKAE